MKEDPVLNAPIRSLQLMLRTLSFLDSDYPGLIPDGVFGTATAGAVSTFQQKHGLPVTGIADLETHRAIVADYDKALPRLTPAEAPIAWFPADLSVSPGQSHPHVFLTQGLLAALSSLYPQLPAPALTGRIDEETEEALRAIQSLHGLSPTGKLAGETYHLAARLYRGSLERDRVPGCG